MKSKKLHKWAEKVIEKITPFAHTDYYDQTFYPLQSPIRENPEILILGLNPRGNFNYKSQSENPIWEFKNGKMTINRLLNGNPTYVATFQNWTIIKGLRKIQLFDKIIGEGKYVYANYYYLNSENFNDISKQSDALEECKKLTYELIEILQPKLILILGTSQGIDKLNEFQNRKVLLSGKTQRLLISSHFNNIPALAIPHPSWLKLSKDELEALNKNILEFYEGKTLTKFSSWQKKELGIQFDFKKFEENLNNAISSEALTFRKMKDKNQYEGIMEGQNDTLRIFLDLKQKYIAVRDANFNRYKGNDRFYKHLEGLQQYLECFQAPFNAKSEGHLIKKKFSHYSYNSIDELYGSIIVDITKLHKEIK